jgi:hypothetical protein
MAIYVFEAPTFFSPMDEELFFIGLRLVPEVRKYRGANVSMFLQLSAPPSRELLGLMSRYATKLRKPLDLRLARRILRR